MKTLLVSGVLAASLALAIASGSPAAATHSASAVTSANAGTSRQTGLGTGVLGAIGSMFPAVVSNMLPLVLLFGLGALMVPALGLGLLLREGRRQDQPIYYYRSFPSFNINTSALVDGVADVLEKVIKALDNADKKYK
jgi:hypothetical protein